MVDTGAGGTVLTREAYEAAKTGAEEEVKEVEITGTGGPATGIKATRVRRVRVCLFGGTRGFCSVPLYIPSLLSDHDGLQNKK